jgi:hypothetical protein
MISKKSTRRIMKRIISRKSRMRVRMGRKRRNNIMRSPKSNPSSPNRCHRRRGLSLILIRISAGMMGH